MKIVKVIKFPRRFSCNKRQQILKLNNDNHDWPYTRKSIVICQGRFKMYSYIEKSIMGYIDHRYLHRNKNI